MRKLFICLLCSFLLCGVLKASVVLIADFSMSRMLELTTRQPYCHVHTDRGTIRTMLLSADSRRVRQMSDDSIDKLVDVCKNKQVVSAHQGGFIYPGTKWCGPGDIADNSSDLGYHAKEDACCREHDRCPKFMMTGECRRGLCNKTPYTRSHCDCDAAFRKCLQNVNTETANTIGAIFFNIVQVVCFRERSPCSEWQNSNEVDEFLVSLFNFPEENGGCEYEFVNSTSQYVPKRKRTFYRRKKSLIVSHLLRNLLML